jgi:mannose-1-phosphate guanylyltransferase/mannose-6-phosphate isomerase
MSSIVPIILSGGSGTRLWPLSRQNYPKQYLPLTNTSSMLQDTITRLNGLGNILEPIIICNKDHRFIVVEQCEELKISNPKIMLEPEGRNTAPAIAAAAIHAAETYNDPILLVLSADHLIQDVLAFHESIKIAFEQAENEKLVVFGVTPYEVNTNYGYIKTTDMNFKDVYPVEKFVEKPNKKTAESYLKQGNYLWNSGMFVFKAKTLIKELSIYSIEIVDAVRKSIARAEYDLNFIYLEGNSFKSSPSDSIDYALMEKSDNSVVIPLDAQWNDIGSWAALYDISDKDTNGNVIGGDVYTKDTNDSYISANYHLIASIGIKNLVIVDTVDAIFISSKDQVHDVKNIVEKLKIDKRKEVINHRKVNCAWGWFESIEMNGCSQIIRLNIHSKKKLLLEIEKSVVKKLIVIKGALTIKESEKISILRKGESIDISRESFDISNNSDFILENKTNKPLEVLEIIIGIPSDQDSL